MKVIRRILPNAAIGVILLAAAIIGLVIPAAMQLSLIL